MSGTAPNPYAADGMSLPVADNPYAAPEMNMAPPGHAMAGPAPGTSIMDNMPQRLGNAGIAAISGVGSSLNLLGSGVDWLGRQVGADPGISTYDPLGRGHPLLPRYNDIADSLYRKTGSV